MHRCHKQTTKEFKKSRPDPIKSIFSATVNRFTYRIPDISPVRPAERTFIPIPTTNLQSARNWFAIIWLSQSRFLYRDKELSDREDDDGDDGDDGDGGDGGDDGDGDDGDGDGDGDGDDGDGDDGDGDGDGDDGGDIEDI